jgi:predicted FMN-binding regulatory protein PaiB
MDIKNGFTTSSKEQLRSLVRVHELDEITSNGGEDRSVTKKHPRGLKRKRPTSCTENLHLGREDDIVKMVQVEGAKCIITQGLTGVKG